MSIYWLDKVDINIADIWTETAHHFS